MNVKHTRSTRAVLEEHLEKQRVALLAMHLRQHGAGNVLPPTGRGLFHRQHSLCQPANLQQQVLPHAPCSFKPKLVAEKTTVWEGTGKSCKSQVKDGPCSSASARGSYWFSP